MSRLTSLRNILDRQELLLGECADDEAARLLCEVKAVAREVAVVEASEDEGPREHDAVERGIAVLVRVRAYARQTERDWYTVDTPAPRPDDTETIYLSSDQAFILAHRMPAGATEPPKELQEAVDEAQGVGRFETEPSPPPVHQDVTTKPEGGKP